MDSIRKLVSGNRRRFTEEDVNLDLSYITPQIIAMSYPSSGIEGLYRNPIEKVSKNAFRLCLGRSFSQRKALEQLLDHKRLRACNLR